jgi:predicted enzyme related to lactoylglutathione lyase
MAEERAGELALHSAVPILRVRDLGSSIEYYVKKLGFKVDWEHEGLIGSVSRGKCGLMLSEGDQGNPGSWVWIGVDDAAALFDDLRERGAIVQMPPTNFSWALEMHIEDPDGNVLRFGSEPIENQPYGAWVDMKRRRWKANPDGGWRADESETGND